MQQLLGVPRKTHTSRSTSNDNGTLGQRGALRQEADDFSDREDEVTVYSPYVSIPPAK